jgi:serine phosphatase RsbU (regulator of sigma subunit)
MRAADTFVGGAKQNDDMTLVVLRATTPGHHAH